MAAITDTSIRRSRSNIAKKVGAAAILMMIVAALGVASPAPAGASHFRADRLTWVKTGANDASFTLNASFRRSYFGNPNVGDTFSEGSIEFGDSTSVLANFTATSVDIANDVVTGVATASHTYATTGPFTAVYQTCCRLGGPDHVNNPSGSYRTETLVNLLVSNGSPQSAISPIVDCPINAVCNFVVPATDSQGFPLSYRLATNAESALNNPVGATINGTTGVYSWDTTGATVNPAPASTFYSTQVIVEKSTGGNVVSTVAVDFFIRLGTGTSNQAPIFENPTAADGAVLAAGIGTPFSFNVAGSDPDGGDTVTLGVINAPTGSTFNNTPGNPATGQFAWTPTAVGDYILILTATDQFGLQATQRSVTIRVGTTAPTTQPTVPPPTVFVTTTVPATTSTTGPTTTVPDTTIPDTTIPDTTAAPTTEGPQGIGQGSIPQPRPPQGTGGNGLARTGSNFMGPIGIGALLLLAGTGIVFGTRRWQQGR